MPNLLATLHQLPEHNQAEETPFVLRMRLKSGKPSQLDAIHHLQQLYHLYVAMEKRLQGFSDDSRLSYFNQAPWANRSALLKNDIEEMRALIPASQKSALEPLDKIYLAFETAIADIEASDELDLLAFYLVRCLGDVFGGQHLQGYTNKTFKGHELKGEFYKSVKQEIRTISAKVKASEYISEKDIPRFISKAKQVFQYHLDLFAEMETARPQIESLYHKLPSYKSCQRATLWGVGAAATVAASVAIGMSLSSN